MTSPKATATATVVNGSASTSNITYNEQLTAGTYTIDASYPENSTYEGATGSNTLTISKISTTTTITSASDTITEGESVNITVVVTGGGSSLSHGVVKLYEDNVIISNVNVSSTSTVISYTPQTTGTHTLRAVWEDTTGSYTNSNSTDYNITVEPASTPLTMTINGSKFELPANYLTYTGAVTIDYGDGTTSVYDGTAVSHNYTGTGGYTVRIKGTVTSLQGLVPVTSRSYLISVTIPDSVTSLGNSCFSNCSSLTSVTIPSSVTSLGNSCFNNCSSLTSVTIPSSVTSLKTSCFNNCSSLTSVTIPNSVTSLGYNCFGNCTILEEIILNWSTTNKILSYNSNWIRNAYSGLVFRIPAGTTSLYTAKGYPSDKLVEY